jgi:hypothetical protein
MVAHLQKRSCRNRWRRLRNRGSETQSSTGARTSPTLIASMAISYDRNRSECRNKSLTKITSFTSTSRSKAAIFCRHRVRSTHNRRTQPHLHRGAFLGRPQPVHAVYGGRRKQPLPPDQLQKPLVRRRRQPPRLLISICRRQWEFLPRNRVRPDIATAESIAGTTPALPPYPAEQSVPRTRTATPSPPPVAHCTCLIPTAKPAHSSLGLVPRAPSALDAPARGIPGVRVPDRENPLRNPETGVTREPSLGRSPALARPQGRFARDIASPMSRSVPRRSRARGSAASHRPTQPGSSRCRPPRVRSTRTLPNSRSLPCCGVRPAKTECTPTSRRAAPDLVCCGNSPPRCRPLSQSRGRESNTGSHFLDAEPRCRGASESSTLGDLPDSMSPRWIAFSISTEHTAPNYWGFCRWRGA